MKAGYLKSTKKVKIATGVTAAVLSASLMAGGVMYFMGYKQTDAEIIDVPAIVKLDELNDTIQRAKEYDVLNLIGTDKNGNIIRFEAEEKTSIAIVVDETSDFGMTDTNKRAIKNAIINYNEAFKVINPNIKFRYISQADYDAKQTKMPCIFITSTPNINSANGVKYASTSEGNVFNSGSGNGFVRNRAEIVLNAKEINKLTEVNQTAVINHSLSHALGVNNHSEDVASTMSEFGSEVSISSSKLSKDTLLALFSLYYNDETNPKTEKEVLEYINSLNQTRIQELKEEGFGDSLGDATQSKYASYVELYAKSIGVVVTEPQRLIGAEFENYNINNSTIKVIFKEDGTYVYEVKVGRNKQSVTGTYTIINNTIVCDGPYVTREGTKFEIVAGEQLYFNALSDNSCIYGSSNGGKIINVLKENENIIEK